MSAGGEWGWHCEWPAPAKLNLFLHVVGRRPDGYHLLQTLFRFIDRGDSLRFEPRNDGQVVLARPLPGVPPEQDLTIRAVRLLQTESGCDQGVTLHLEKRLPMGGGLGGGSSDAATVLLALNHLWGLGLGRPRLQALGLSLGADVPVFVHGRNTFAEGVGEEFFPVQLPPAWYLVLVPPVAVPTAAIFTAPDLRRDAPRLDPGAWHPGLGSNDLEPVACSLYPIVGQYLGWLRERVGEARSRMSGSGACVFAECASEAEARELAAQLPAAWQGWVARGLEAHPLEKLGI
ncbi:4-(cytidine 5'-diphospho)-2-C-methyl-D-erythritol kinase [Azovibrio restrictus]|uniref:4-(cytidine 5'-diphospho)-2-C-methyl-D-erythritol kinase n=1 Tax=Azovibrio restrictus TaxID=146938 RepID=UPI0026F2A467|nr:4-(cytidine 5'-diphospho)-2-C-methyl-D-erythritol kinase [Azovibrio restrictus]MDD3481444.1 4-(cytidine 5'-diphospho)-2-C-methyl-D-erythritol kinase [Azovibrio restrictus]